MEVYAPRGSYLSSCLLCSEVSFSFFCATRTLFFGEKGPDEDHETMRIMPIGAGNEVGRSCVILKYMGKTIMLDCGIHPVRK